MANKERCQGMSVAIGRRGSRALRSRQPGSVWTRAGTFPCWAWVCFALPRVVGCQPTAAQLHHPFISLFCPLTSLFSIPSCLLPPAPTWNPSPPLYPIPRHRPWSRTKDLLTFYRPFDRPAPSPSIPSRLQFFNLPTSIQSFPSFLLNF